MRRWAASAGVWAIGVSVVAAVSGAAPPMRHFAHDLVTRSADVTVRGRPVPIPAFSRLYGTACSTCHTAAPKLNVFGEAFRLNGYRMPTSELVQRRDEPVSLGAPEWDEAWPRSIRSSDLPGIAPLAFRIVSDARITRDKRLPYDATYRFPEQVQLLAGAPLGDAVSAFASAGWNPDEGFRVHRADVELRDPIPGLPSRILKLAIGLHDPYLLTFGHQHSDRAAREAFLWQTFDASEIEIVGDGEGETIRTDNDLTLGEPQPALELDGLIGRRLFIGLGLSQGLGHGATDRNGRKDVYYKIRYKLGGLDFAGTYDSERIPEQRLAGQLLDRSLTLEHFGYWGSESTESAPQGGHSAFGFAARARLERLELGAGYVALDFERPWSELPAGRLDAESLFARAEYLALPWVMVSLKVENLRVDARRLPPDVSAVPAPTESTRVLPGIVFLLRQNVRLATEADLYLSHPATQEADLPLPHNLWFRLDVAF